MPKLLDAYSGENAQIYDERRQKSARWAQEVAAMGDILSELKPEVVLDCPFGTGRWTEQYLAIDAGVVGVDLSEGMLAEAKQKLEAAGIGDSDRFRFIEASIFDIGSNCDVGDIDCALCIRFVNWIPMPDVHRAMAALSSTSASSLVVGASVVPSDTGFLKKLSMKKSLAKTNKKAAGKPPQHVHNEDEFLAAVQENGWTLKIKTPIFQNKSRENFFYVFTR